MNVCWRAAILLPLMSILAACPMNHSDEISRIFADYQGDNAPGAAVLVISGGDNILVGTYGLADLDNREPVRRDTNFRLASVSKQFTAMSILILVERDELQLTESLREIFPDFPEFAEGISVTNLLQHTSGLLDYEDFVPADSPTQVTDSDVLEILKKTDHTYFEPGSEYRYSNSAYAVLAMIVEKYSHQPYADFLRENIFEPLGMHNSVAFQNGISSVPSRAYGYSVTDGSVMNTDQSPWSAVLGDGGIYSSLDDLYKWDQALYTDRLISRALLEEAFTPNLENYGFGWRIDVHNGRKRYHHSGSTSGFRTYIERYPDEQFSVIVLTNRADPEVGPLAEQVSALFLK